MRTLHEAGPELKRAISGNLEELDDNPEPMHRVRLTIIIFYIPGSLLNNNNFYNSIYHAIIFYIFRETTRSLAACGPACEKDTTASTGRNR